MLKRIRRILAAAVLAAAPVVTLLMPGIAHAATITWQGGGADNKWSTVGNWVGGVAPTSGDSIVIDNSATFTLNTSVDDIVGLSLASITFSNDAATSPIIVQLAQPLTVTTAITQDSTVTSTTDAFTDNGTAKTLTLGGNVTVTTNAGLSLGDAGDTLALGANTLTLTDNGGSTSSIIVINANVTGTGGIVFNGPATEYQLGGANTYSGPTHVIATDLPIDNTGTNNNPFGTSAVTLETGGAISFTYTVNTTINNDVTISGTTNGSPVTSLSFDDSGTSGLTFTVPHLTLNGETRFSNDSVASPTPLKVDLSGITANNFCIEYLGYGNDATNGPANGFLNGPAGCVVAAATAPAKPNTGFALLEAHPVVTLAVTVASALAIAVIARRTSASRR